MGEAYIRLAPYEPKWREGVLEIAREMHGRSIYAKMPLEEDRLMAQLAGPYSTKPNYRFRLAVRNTYLYGGFLGVVGRMFFGSGLVANDIGWFVRNSKRGSAAAALLLTDFENWARNEGAVLCLLGQSTGIDIEKTVKLYSHCGYRTVGYNTVKEL